MNASQIGALCEAESRHGASPLVVNLRCGDVLVVERFLNRFNRFPAIEAPAEKEKDGAVKSVIRPLAREDILRQYRYFLIEEDVPEVVRILHGQEGYSSTLESSDELRQQTPRAAGSTR
jgi:hypothetical protein